MIKDMVKKAVENYAKASTNSCVALLWHAPKAPRSLIAKDQAK